MRKKKLLFQSDAAIVKTGFGRNTKCLLNFLHKTGKYEIINYCCGINFSNPNLQRTPWKSIGCLPDNQQEIDHLNKDPGLAQKASYGAYLIDKVIKEEKPDVYIAVQDIWGVDFAIDKKWFNKISSVIWTTLDSLPLLPGAVDNAPKIKNYWIWSNFATKEMHRLGHKHVKTVHGSIEDSKFYRLKDEQRQTLRKIFNLPEDAFIIINVFRNQLRKSIPNLLEGYLMWKKQNPGIKNTYLLLHTNFSEGWNIHRLANEYGVDLKEILTTYVCMSCHNYEVKPFTSQNIDCRFCGVKGNAPSQQNQSGSGQITTNIQFGITEEQLNEVYNLADVCCTPFTSGGQEYVIEEAKLTELITLVTNYSCGEEACEPDAYSLPLDWAEYREHGTEFRKASTLPSSIAKQINKVYNMPPDKRLEMGKKGRKWVLDNFSIQHVGKQIEDFIDSCPLTDYSFDEKEEPKDPNAQIPFIQNDKEWVKRLYKDILKVDVKDDDSGLLGWEASLSANDKPKEQKRQEIESFFRETARKDNQKSQQTSFEDLLDKNDKRRVLATLPESVGDIFIATSLFESIRKRYPKPEWTFYFACKPEYFEILDANPYLDKIIPYIPEMDNFAWGEGQAGHKGFFDVVYPLHISTQRLVFYPHNSLDIIDLQLKGDSYQSN